MPDYEISLNIYNNTNAVIDVSLMGNPADLADNANATREFQWDITSLVFSGLNTVSVQYRANGQSTWRLYEVEAPVTSVQGLVMILNGLGIGSFFTFTSGPNTYISNYDDNYEFGVLNVYNNAAPQLIYNYNTSTVTGGSVDVDINLVNVLSVPNPALASGGLTVSAGDTVTFYGSATAAPNNFIAEIYEDATLIFSSSFVLNFTHTFTVAAGKTYSLNCYDTP